MIIKFTSFIKFGSKNVSMTKEIEWPCLPNKGDCIFVGDELELEIDSILHEIEINQISILLEDIKLHHEEDYEDIINMLKEHGWN
jgi:hypothetical protein